ncbi:MAG: amino acid permease [Methanospirillum sp.]
MTRSGKPLRLRHVVALYTGAVLGSGILVLPGLAADLAGPASLVAWALMAVLVIPMALTMGLLSSRFPDAGGVSSFVTRAFNPLLGSLIGWFFLLSVVVGAPVLALTGAGYLCATTGLGDSFRLLIGIIILAIGLLVNYRGVKITGQVQVAVVLTTITVLVATVAGSLAAIAPTNFVPFTPYGWVSVGHASTVIFWCFIGWEAVSHLADEFENPQRDAVHGTIIAAGIVSALYILTAFVVVGTHSYGPAVSDISLVRMIGASFGETGAFIAGGAALFICMAPAIAYIGAAARLTRFLASNGFAPRVLSYSSKRYMTPAGGLLFLAVCFTVLLFVFSTRIVSLSSLIQVPSGTFLLTYIGGSAAGVVLLKDSTWGFLLSAVSLLLTVLVFLFIGVAVWYPLAIIIVWGVFVVVSRKDRSVSRWREY